MTQTAYPGDFADGGGYAPPSQAVKADFEGSRPRAMTVLGWFAPASLVPTYLGVAIIAAGFALIGVAWAQIAALTNVSLQIPYLVSAGFTGLALIMVGLMTVNIAAKRQDGAERTRQMQTLTDTFEALRREIARLDLPGDDR